MAAVDLPHAHEADPRTGSATAECFRDHGDGRDGLRLPAAGKPGFAQCAEKVRPIDRRRSLIAWLPVFPAVLRTFLPLDDIQASFIPPQSPFFCVLMRLVGKKRNYCLT